MTTKRMTKQERAQRESTLVETLFMMFAETVEEQARLLAERAIDLMKGLSDTAIRRARRIALKRSDERPPGFVRATEALDVYNDLCRKYGVSKDDTSIMWGVIAQHSMFQLAAGRGPFYDAARYFGLVRERQPRFEDMSVQVIRVRSPNCDCPNCRTRTAEELN